jgi:hypothetical protein
LHIGESRADHLWIPGSRFARPGNDVLEIHQNPKMSDGGRGPRLVSIMRSPPLQAELPQ